MIRGLLRGCMHLCPKAKNWSWLVPRFESSSSQLAVLLALGWEVRWVSMRLVWCGRPRRQQAANEKRAGQRLARVCVNACARAWRSNATARQPGRGRCVWESKTHHAGERGFYRMQPKPNNHSLRSLGRRGCCDSCSGRTIGGLQEAGKHRRTPHVGEGGAN